MRATLALCCLLVVCRASLLSGQAATGTLAQVGVGTRVRVSAPALSEFGLKGSIWATSPDTLYLATSGEITHAVPLHVIERLEVSLGRTQPALVGAGVGAFALGAFGSYMLRYVDRPAPSTGRQVVEVGAFAAAGGIAGGLVGALLGERWRQVFP